MATKKYPLILVLLLCGYILLDSAVDAKQGRKKPKPSKGNRQNENSDQKACGVNMFAYAPVCASDGEVYINQVHLKCHQKNNPDLQRADPSHCKDFAEQKASMKFIAASDPGKPDTQRIKKPTKPKKRKGKGRRILKEKLCTITREYAPTCGSDGIMYSNTRALRCAKRNNPDLHMVARAYCEKTSEENSNERSSSSESNSVETKVEDSKIARQCVVPLYLSPTCGSDGIMYGNPHRLRCAQKRNPDLRQVDRAFCEKKSEENSNESSSIAENGSRIKEVEEPVYPPVCPVTRNHRPTCGSDGIMYSNPSELRCAQRKNPDLHAVDRSNCPSGEEV